MNNQFDKFTPNAKKALVAAQKEAHRMGSSYIGTEHLILGILLQKKSLGAEILNNSGIRLEKIYLVLEMSVRSISETQTKTGLSEKAKNSIEQAVDIARRYNHPYIGTEHLLLGLLAQKDSSSAALIKSMKVDEQKIKDQINSLFERSSGFEKFNKEPMFAEAGPNISAIQTQTKTKTPALDYFSTDLISLAKNKKLDPVVGREKEIERLIQILNRRTKNNPVLIGDPGVGKTAIVEGLASKIIKGEVPDSLMDKRILAIDLV